MKYSMLIVLGLASLVLGWQGPAEADFLLSFGSSTYSVGGGRTVQVQVFGSQNTNGTQITPTNGLTLAGIAVSFNNPPGVAAVTSMSSIVGGPLFDTSVSSVALTQATLTDASLAGIGTLPVLLGTFTFNGLQIGTTQISVAPISPGPSFAAAMSGAFQPASTATATLNVTPEPTSILVLLTGVPVLLGVAALQGSRPGTSRKSGE